MGNCHGGFKLPEDAPKHFHSLLRKWLEICGDHPPTTSDLPFDDLVKQHPGLALITPTLDNSHLIDLAYARAGPEYKKQMNFDPTGLTYIDIVRPRLRERCLLVFGEAMRSKRPHYWHISSLVHGYSSNDYERLLLPLFTHTGEFEAFLIDCYWRAPTSRITRLDGC